MNRRGFLRGALALVTLPGIERAYSFLPATGFFDVSSAYPKAMARKVALNSFYGKFGMVLSVVNVDPEALKFVATISGVARHQ